MSQMQSLMERRYVILSIMYSLSILVLLLAVYVNNIWFWYLPIVGIITILTTYNVIQKSHSILSNYPLVGYARFMLEGIRPELRQYFWESDLDGRPFNRRQRSIVYQRSKNAKQTVAFGMQDDFNKPGFEYVTHSMFPVSIKETEFKTTVGNIQCSQPYDLSILNIGAMSYGALSKTAISSLNEGAAMGGFAHNTGEGGISKFHLKGGDLIWQIGTGYFGCRKTDGTFSPELFSLNAQRANVKMIELKLSQGAKPGHGGILPAGKNTVEIAAIRGVAPYTTVFSPPYHTAFKDSVELIRFIGLLRQLSGGKPVGFKLCIGDKQEFIDICNAIVETQIYPDFICIDGAEGGTGAAPLEFTDNIGVPLYDGLAFANNTLKAFRLSEHIKLIAAGKIISAFDIMKALALGASACYSARGMMFSLGCIQALQCDSGKCPVGIATQNPGLYNGLSISDKRVRVANYHRNTIAATIEMMEACGVKTINDISAAKIFRRINRTEVRSFEDIYFSNDELMLKTIITNRCILN